ncbi:hypothetical protein AC249_AIPGENE26471 [Exaiptasia diaphana]|nr:hypothetical protein AC249_AIPGENE26471 [Exaiptasia diaphana]
MAVFKVLVFCVLISVVFTDESNEETQSDVELETRSIYPHQFEARLANLEKEIKALENSQKNELRGRDGRDGQPGSPGKEGKDGKDGNTGKEGTRNYDALQSISLHTTLVHEPRGKEVQKSHDDDRIMKNPPKCKEKKTVKELKRNKRNTTK